MRTPNILLAMPSGVKTHFPYLGLAYIQAYMKQRFGKDIRIKTVDLSKKSFSKIRDVLSSAKPDLLGIGCMTFTRKESFRIAEIAKEINSDVITVFGGHHCQYLWKQVLTHYPQVDYIVHGEGELILGDLVETLFFGNALNINKVNGISYRQDGIPITTAPAQPIVVLDSLPFPDYGDFDMVQYAEDDWQNKDSRSTIALPVLSSRGCPYLCYFCCDGQSRRKWRKRSIGNVIEEIACYKDRFKSKFFHIADDTFTVNKQYVYEFCRAVMDNRFDMKWDARARPQNLDREMMSVMKEAGCYSLNMGIESGSPEILKNMNKKHDIEQAIDIIRMARDMGISISVNILIGYPGENDSTIKETLRFICRARPHAIAANILMVFPGAEIYNYCKSIGYLNDEVWLNKKKRIVFYTHEQDYSTLMKYEWKCYLTSYKSMGFLAGIRQMVLQFLWQRRRNPRHLLNIFFPWAFK